MVKQRNLFGVGRWPSQWLPHKWYIIKVYNNMLDDVTTKLI
jgi:hypothetical protein